jgi:phosphoheptose isomerase
MKYFEKTSGAEARELARITAAIAKKNKKIKKVIDAPIKVIPQDKAAVIHEKHLVTTADSKRMLADMEFKRSL